MKTRVVSRYNIHAGEMIYGVEIWQERRLDPWARTHRTSIPGVKEDRPELYIPAHWAQWCASNEIFWTPDEQKARRIACDLSTGKMFFPEPVAEFVDGVEFTALSGETDAIEDWKDKHG